ncbi:MAG: lycopene cyclase family protein, partial [Catalinimonas sp.]
RYLHEVLKLQDYRVTDTEKGAIPMWDHPFERRVGQHVLNIGTRGGATKPSTGYTFIRTQHDAARITESLRSEGHPFAAVRPSGRYATYDTMLLQILYRRGHLAERIFTDLFRHNPVGRLLRFLDEETTPLEDLRVMASVPPEPFLRAFWRTKVQGRV